MKLTFNFRTAGQPHPREKGSTHDIRDRKEAQRLIDRGVAARALPKRRPGGKSKP